MEKLTHYAGTINEVLLRRKVVDTPLVWEDWASPEFMGPRTYGFSVNLAEFPGRQMETLHSQKVLNEISTMLGGIKVGFANTQGFAYIVKDEPVPALDPVDILSTLAKNPCALISGTKGAGKTSLLQHLIYHYKNQIVVVFDPKPRGENDWLHAKVRGLGGDYDDIDRALTDIETLFQHRLRRGPGPPLLIVADEYWTTIKHVRDYSSRLLEIMATGRTSNLDLVVGTHSRRVKGMDIEGEGDVLDNFINIKLSKINERHQATIDFGEGPLPARHPGPFFSDDDKILATIAIQYNGGYCSVGKMEKFIKANPPLKRRYWDNGGPFTYHRLQNRFKEWEARGWLSPASQASTGQKIGRQVTAELRKLAGL